MNKKISFPIALIIIIVLAVLVVGGVFAYQYYLMPKPVACTQEAKVCPDGSSVGRTGPNCEFAICPNKNNKSEKLYNHAGKIEKIYQKDGKNYVDINFIKFLLFIDENGSITNNPSNIYGENDEAGNCAPVADSYCIIDNDKTIKSYEVAENVEIIPASYPGNPIPYNKLSGSIINSPYFKLQIENNVIQKMHQIYIP